MTLDSTTSKVQYTQSGSTTEWPVPFKFLDNDHLIVITTVDGVDTTLVLDTDYIVAGAGDDEGGTVTISPAVATGTRVTIYREIDLDQPTELTTAGGWFPKVHEAVFDRLTMIAQQLQEQLDRSVKLAPSTALDPDTVAEELFEAMDDAQTAASEAEASAARAEVAAATVAYYNHEGTLLTGEDTISLPWAYDTEVGVEVFLAGVKQAESTLTFTDEYTVTLDTPVAADTTFEVVASAGAKSDLADLLAGTGGATLVGYGSGTVADALTDRPTSATLAASGGSALVGFLQDGTGAVATTVQAKLRESVSVKDFGAIGDGVADDTAAFALACASGRPVFVPSSSGNYILTSLTEAHRKLLFGPGLLVVGGSATQISSEPFINSSTAHVRVYNSELQPAKWPSVDGSLRNGAISVNATRTGGFGSYGLTLTEYLVQDALPTGEFDVGATEWVTAQNLAGGAVFGHWAGSNTPSSALGQTFTSGQVIGQETNVGNRWGDFGLQDDLGGTRYTVGHQIVPDVLPALDGSTVDVYPGTFGEAIAQSVHGHKWWTGYLVSSDAIVPGGRVFNIRGGSVVGNAAGVLLRATDFFTRGIDFSGATISTQALLFGANQTISWGAGGGTSVSGTATTFGLSTGTGTGEGGLFCNNYAQRAMRWASTGSAPTLGFFGAAAVGKPTVTGSKGGNAALASLVTALSNLGLVTDSTT